MKTVEVIIGTLRPTRSGPSIAKWAAKIGQDVVPAGVQVNVLDLKDWPLPMDGEPAIPAMGNYQTENTKRWSKKIADTDGFVFVTPQYNGGYPAPLKNAIDHLKREWGGKPAIIITYGSHGGGKCGGQLTVVLEHIGMSVIVGPALSIPREIIASNNGDVDASRLFKNHVPELKTAFSKLSQRL